MFLPRFIPLLFAGLLLLPVSVLAKPTPPASLMKVFTHFIAGEDVVEEEDWAGTDKWLADLNKEFQTIRPQMVKDISAAPVEKFEKSMATLRASSTAHSKDRIHANFIALHTSFLELLDHFDYKLPPLMFLVQSDIKEVESGIKEGDLDEVADEFKDIETFYGQLTPILKARGVNSEMIESFNAQQVRCKGALAAGDKNKLNSEFTKLKQLFAAQYQQLSSK